jgi:hypothetical protein
MNSAPWRRLAPLLHFRESVRRAVEQVQADGVANCPLSKSRHQRSICAAVTRAGSSRNAASIRGSYCPSSKAGRELVSATEALRNPLNRADGNAERVVRGNAVPRHRLAGALGTETLELGNDGRKLLVEPGVGFLCGGFAFGHVRLHVTV